MERSPRQAGVFGEWVECSFPFLGTPPHASGFSWPRRGRSLPRAGCLTLKGGSFLGPRRLKKKEKKASPIAPPPLAAIGDPCLPSGCMNAFAHGRRRRARCTGSPLSPFPPRLLETLCRLRGQTGRTCRGNWSRPQRISAATPLHRPPLHPLYVGSRSEAARNAVE